MLTEKDLGMGARVAILVAALVLFLQPLGVDVPQAWAAGVPLVTLVVVAVVRVYVMIRGADNTKADETLEAVEGAIENAAATATKKGPRFEINIDTDNVEKAFEKIEQIARAHAAKKEPTK